MGYIQLPEMKRSGVLLFHSETLIPSRANQFFDHSNWNHSGLFCGPYKGKSYNVSKSVASCVGVHTPKESKADHTRLLVCRMIDNMIDMDPVLNEAQSCFGHSFAFPDTVHLALICIIRWVSINPFLDNFLRVVLDAAAREVNDFLTAGRDKQPMVCSSYLFRSYIEALPETVDKYTIRIGQESNSPLFQMCTATTIIYSKIFGYNYRQILLGSESGGQGYAQKCECMVTSSPKKYFK